MKDKEKKNVKSNSPVKKESKKTEKPETKTVNKPLIIGIIIAVVVAIICAVGLTTMLTANHTPKTIKTAKGRVKIVQSAAKKVEYEKFDNGLVSFLIPKGWKVEVAALDYIHYSFKAYDPKNPIYSFVFCMKLEGFNKTEEARNWQKKYYPSVMFAKTPVIDPQTTEAFYKVWNETATYVNTVDVKHEYLPMLNEFTVIENLGANVIGGDIIRATYKDENGALAQGLFTATVKSAGTYYVNSNVFNLYSKKIDVWPLDVYNIILMSAPDSEFVNWQGVLDKCVSSIAFSEEFVKGFNKEESSIMSTIQANQKIYNQMSDMIMDSWEKRNNSYDIISQKQSDATLGYERVYDTETGEIYKAYNGFTDDYSGERYKAITDDMYTSAISGYIEK